MTGQPIMAPSGINAAIHEMFSSVTGKLYCLFFIIGPAGDVHPSVVPMMNPETVTTSILHCNGVHETNIDYSMVGGGTFYF
jgi:hypothetical protein